MRIAVTAMQSSLFVGPLAGLCAGLLVAGCAWSGQQRQEPPPEQTQAKTQGQPPARPMKPIDDVEPAVTQEVAAALARIAADPQAETAPLLRTCPSAVPLELLLRTVKGEERNYLYRARCDASLLVAVTYGKSATIKQLSVKKE